MVVLAEAPVHGLAASFPEAARKTITFRAFEVLECGERVLTILEVEIKNKDADGNKAHHNMKNMQSFENRICFN